MNLHQIKWVWIILNFCTGEHTIQGQDDIEEPAENDDEQTLDGVQEVEDQQPQQSVIEFFLYFLT